MDTITGSEAKKKTKWHILTLIFFLFSTVSFFLNQEDLSGSVIRLWSIRFLFLTVLFFVLGMAFNNATIKAVMFSMLAIFAALGVGESYLSYLDSRGNAHKNTQTAIPREFAEEFAELAQDNKQEIKDTTVEEQQEAYFLDNIDEIKTYFKNDNIANLQNAVLWSKAYDHSPDLGYRFKKEAATGLSVKKNKDGLIYKAVYTISPDGWRITPQNPQATEAVIFIGCSFTFGEGLNDKDSFPYQAAEMLGDKYQVFNYGLPGYGPHQMLSMIENGYLDEIAKKYKKIHVFYMTIESHASRIAGKSSWDQEGPCYELDPNGDVHRNGSFKQCLAGKKEASSLLLKKLTEKKYLEALHIAVTKKTARLLHEKYGIKLTVLIIWQPDYISSLGEKDYVNILDVLDPSVSDFLIPGDGHPNAKGAAMFARTVTEYILASDK